MRPWLVFPLLLLAFATAGCGEPKPDSPADHSAVWAFPDEGHETLEFAAHDAVVIALTLPIAGPKCQYSAIVKVTHRDQTNFTFSGSGMFLQGFGTDAIQMLPGAVVGTSDSLNEPGVAVTVGNVQVNHSVSLAQAFPDDGTSVEEIRFSGDVSASADFYQAFALQPVASPVLNLMVVSNAPAGSQDIALELEWSHCKVAWRATALGQRLVATARDFTGDLSALAGIPWLASGATWSGHLASPTTLRIWGASCPQAEGVSCSMMVVPTEGPAVEIATVHLQVSHNEQEWTIELGMATAIDQASKPVFFATSVEPARLAIAV